MQEHTSLYYDFFGYAGDDFVPSEISGGRAVDIHHIHARQRGGGENMDRIENLMALSREEHLKYGDKVQYKAFLYKRHLEVLEVSGKEFDREWILAQIEKYS